MSRRVCCEPGCPTLTDKSRCERHRRERERARGTRQERGYDAEHDRQRAAWQLQLDQGKAIWCWRCLEHGRRTRIDPANWHLGHDDLDRSKHRGPECPPCNLATAGRISSLT